SHPGTLFFSSRRRHTRSKRDWFRRVLFRSDDMIRHFDDIQVVLYDNDRIPVIHKTLDDIDEFPYILRMEAGRRFIQYIEGFAVGPPVQLGSEFDTLCFTA